MNIYHIFNLPKNIKKIRPQVSEEKEKGDVSFSGFEITGWIPKVEIKVWNVFTWNWQKKLIAQLQIDFLEVVFPTI